MFLLALEPQTVVLWVVMGVLVAGLILWMVLSGRKRKKQEQDAQDLINAVGPGNKVKTIGGICGIVVEVDNEENTFVLETGSLTSGKSYIKFDKQAIYQTDAVVPSKAEDKGETPETAEETPAEAPGEAEVKSEAPAEKEEEQK